MAKFLRVLVVLIFILSAAALTFGILLFAKREILKGRTYKLEEGLIRLARTLEAEPPKAPETPPAYPARDIAGVTADIIDNPTTSPFWNTYKHELESLDQPLVDLNPRRRELMSYYKINPITMKPERDQLTNLKISSGPGTTQAVIDYAIERASEQYNLLTETRQQLQIIRDELIITVRDLNDQKKFLRDRLVHIVQLNNEIAQLNRTIDGLRRDLQAANDEIAEKKLQIADLEAQIQKLEEDNDGLTLKTEEQAKIIDELRNRIRDLMNPTKTDDPGMEMTSSVTLDRIRGKIPAGVKGRVISVDQKNLFVVMDVEPTFIKELFGAVTDGPLPMVELLIQRENPEGGKSTFISKVRLSQVKREKNLVIGDILSDWQQGPINEGDIVLFH
jgi:outer membrane murein-binding lipoprotein Lpp